MGLLWFCVKFADLSEYGYGVAILSESKYGFSCRGNALRISLLRAATAPDAEQDHGSLFSATTPAALGRALNSLGYTFLYFTQANMNFRGLFYPTVVTSSSHTSPSRPISSTPRCTVHPAEPSTLLTMTKSMLTSHIMTQCAAIPKAVRSPRQRCTGRSWYSAGTTT
jgi:hypothetical protein